MQHSFRPLNAGGASAARCPLPVSSPLQPARTDENSFQHNRQANAPQMKLTNNLLRAAKSPHTSLLGALAPRMQFSPPASRVFVAAAFVLPPLLFWGGWCWARMVLSGYQTQVGSIALDHLPLASHYHRWAITIPHYVTLAAVGLALVPAGVALFRRRHWFVGLCFYALLLFFVSVFVFVGFEFEAFD